jgi:hypothetical protein
VSFSGFALPGRLFRLSRYADPTKLTEWRHLASAAPTRWADPENEYRVLYAADTEVGSYVEILQDLRPSPGGLGLLDAIQDDGQFDDILAPVEAAARERLRQYYFAALKPSGEDLVVDVATPSSRSEIETRLAEDLGGRRLKTGDFSGGDYDLTRRVSRLVFTAVADGGRQYAGIAASSAEHEGTHCLAFFETGRETDELRGQVFPHFVRQALEEERFVREALNYLAS